VLQNDNRVRVIVFNATFNNISVISWRSVLLVEETRGLVLVFTIILTAMIYNINEILLKNSGIK
jgi:hypothetical protein